VFLILAVLVYLQYRPLRALTGGTFWAQTHRIRKIHRLTRNRIDLLRIFFARGALEDFLQPVRPKAKMVDLVSPTDWVHRPGIAGRAGRVYSSVFNRPANGSSLLFPVSGLGGGAHFRCGLYRTDGAGDFSAQRFARDSASGVLPCAFAKVVFLLIGVVLLLT